MTDLRTVLHEIARDAPDAAVIQHRLQRSRRRHTPVLAAASVVGVLVITAGAVLLTRPAPAPPTTNPGSSVGGLPVATPSDPWNAACFGAADLSTDLRADVGLAQKVNAVNTAPRPEDYYDICAQHWQNGIWVTNPAFNTNGSVPPAPKDLQLVGCVLPEGTYGIFPGTDTTCGALNLPLAIAPDPAAGVVESPAPTT